MVAIISPLPVRSGCRQPNSGHEIGAAAKPLNPDSGPAVPNERHDESVDHPRGTSPCGRGRQACSVSAHASHGAEQGFGEPSANMKSQADSDSHQPDGPRRWDGQPKFRMWKRRPTFGACASGRDPATAVWLGNAGPPSDAHRDEPAVAQRRRVR